MICISLPPQFLGVEGMSQPHGSSKRGKKKKKEKERAGFCERQRVGVWASACGGTFGRRGCKVFLIGRGKRHAKGEDVMKFCVSSSGCGKVQSARACRWDPQPLLPQWLPKAKGQSMDALEHILRLAYTCILTMSTAMSFALTVSTPPRP
jgi:hypothetical protein